MMSNMRHFMSYCVMRCLRKQPKRVCMALSPDAAKASTAGCRPLVSCNALCASLTSTDHSKLNMQLHIVHCTLLEWSNFGMPSRQKFCCPDLPYNYLHSCMK
jgi:hypothetical protein